MSSTRPRPRPRPKPKAATQDAAPVAGSSSDSPLKTVQIQIVDDDAMFMRNRNRSTGDWATLGKLTKEAKTTRANSDSDEGDTTPKRKKPRKQDTASPWQNKKSITRMLSEEIPSSDSDDDGGVEIVDMSTTPRASKAAKRKRPRSRSRSITPPPELPPQQVQHMRALVEQTLNTGPQPTTTRDDYEYDNDDALFKNPELARLAKSVKSRPQAQMAYSSPAPEGADTIQISVKWKLHPLDPNGKEDVWVFKMNRDDNFRDLFEATAEEASIRVENLILSYQGKRIYASVTPMALQMWGEAELVGCDKVTHDYLRANPPKADTFDAGGEEFPSVTDAPSPSQNEGSDDKEQESDAEGETFKLTLRSSAATKDITLTVRPTTKCGAIVKAYLKKIGVADQYSTLFDEGGTTKKGGRGKKAQPEKDPRLCVDGDRMGNDVEIGEADLEDGDMVEVMGL
ncbi:hypothetical protein H0H87_000906 [Tephrocybe sp. NHM501043]|nr:hypothetical protein H0H87_000906 [Tephrocybe sp. NHM501043]